jgi:Resolvase, N terminal domain/Helix-turn-helix domain of resolvase
MTRKKKAAKAAPKTITANDPDDLKGQLKSIGGSQSDRWNNTLAGQAVNALWLKHSSPEEQDKQFSAATPHGRLMLTVLGGLAEFERELIRARTGEGRERAKKAGVRFGRPVKLSAHQRREALQRMDAGESVVELARTFGVDRATLYRMQAAANP